MEVIDEHKTRKSRFRQPYRVACHSETSNHPQIDRYDRLAEGSLAIDSFHAIRAVTLIHFVSVEHLNMICDDPVRH
jgi:hypothetical protein